MRPSLDEFRSDARLWLAVNAEPIDDEGAGWGVGPESVAVFYDETDDEAAESIAKARRWHQTKADAGWTAITWPAELGGRDLPAVFAQAFAAEEKRYAVPKVPEAVMITLHLVAPTLDLLGTPSQRAEFVRPFLGLDVLCCQLFSEPNAGSDLASLACRAERAGGANWTIDGQKIWTSGAKQSDYGLLITRSDPAAAKHHGMTAFLLPLDSEGVEIRSIRQMTGGSSFNEVYLDGVSVPDELRIGAEGEGWKVALTMLGFERSISGEGAGGAGGSWHQVLALARHLDATSSPLVRQQLAQLYTRTRVLSMMNERARRAAVAGREPGAVGSIAKLYWVQTLTLTSAVVSGLLGSRLVADAGEWGTFAWAEHVLGVPGYRIAGGSDEIQRNIIGERVLGLPRQP